MRLFEIRAIVEAEDEGDAERVADAIAHAICPHPSDQEHVCPRGWITMSRKLTGADASAWREPDALNR